MKFKMFFLLLLISSVVIKAQNAEEFAAQIEKLNKVYAKALIEKDTKTMMTLYTEDIISLPSYQPMIRGIETLQMLSEGAEKSEWKTTSFEFNTTDIIPAGNFVIEVGNYEMTMTAPGAPEWSDKGKYITIWKILETGDLRIKVEMWNSDLNPWMQMQQDSEQN